MSSAAETSAVISDSRCDHLSFDYQPRTRVVFGAAVFDQLGKIVHQLGGRRVLLVTDPGLRNAGHCSTAVSLLEDAGLVVAAFDDVAPNPTTEDVDRCVAFAADQQIDFIVGLGGGSSMDCAKGANFLLTNGGRMQDYRGVGKATKPMLPMVAVPTTSGTGSEAQSFAVIADPVTHMKMPCGDVKAACRVAILDPALTVTMPEAVAAATGIDALTHAVETFVTTKRNAVSSMFAGQAWELLSRSFRAVIIRPDDLQARGDMLLGAHLAGAAIENSMLGAAHAAANPLSAHFGTVHGVAVGMLLPHVVRWNSAESGELYRELAVAAGWSERSDSSQHATEQLANGFTDLLRAAGMPLTLTDAVDGPVSEETLKTLAAEAAQQWTGTFNPRPMDATAFEQIYRNAM